MIPGNPQPSFPDEKIARAYLEQLIRPFFWWEPEVWVLLPESGNRLRIDYIVKPKPAVDFPFDWFGLETKREAVHGRLNAAAKQAIDYTRCTVDDDRPRLIRLRGQRIERVYLFPAPSCGPDNFTAGWHGGVERLAGKFHVGFIYRTAAGEPFFAMSAERHWCPRWGGRRSPIHVRQTVGSGVARQQEAVTVDAGGAA